MRTTPTVFVVDDDPDFLQTTRYLLESAKLSVETFASAQAFLEACHSQCPGCLLLDVSMPDMTGLELLEELNKRGWSLPTIVMTAYGSVQTAVKAMLLGAINFVEKPMRSMPELIDLIKQVLTTDSRSQQTRLEIEEIGRQLANLSDREQEVLEEVFEGLSSKEIATALSLSVRTVESHRANIMRKLQADSVPQLVRLVLRYRVGTRLDVTLASSSTFCSIETD